MVVAVLLASCVFYMTRSCRRDILILAFTIDYTAGILIERSSGGRRSIWLVVRIVSNLSILATFKCARFAIENLNAVVFTHRWTGRSAALASPAMRINGSRLARARLADDA